MYLPVIMTNRYGWAGYAVFAIPNVLGCAGMGYLIRSRATSESLVANHRLALGAFSLVTIAYHAFFLSWLFTDLAPLTEERFLLPMGFAMGIIALGIGLGHLPMSNTRRLIAAALVYAVSIGAFTTIGFDAFSHVPGGDRPLPELLALGPIVAFGFLLCPYLDATFHRARQETPSRHSFAVFGVTFLIMILMTPVLWLRAPELRPILYAHLLAQTVFTTAVHTRELRAAKLVCCPKRRTIYLGVALLAAVVYPVLRQFLTAESAPGEALYLRFLVFYGLAFPLYVLVFMGRGSMWAPTRRLLGIAAGIAILLAPFYEAGFIQDRTWWLLVPTAVIIAIIVRRAVPNRPRAAMERSL